MTEITELFIEIYDIAYFNIFYINGEGFLFYKDCFCKYGAT